MNVVVMKLNSSVYRCFMYETCCFPTNRDIQPCLGNGSVCWASCKMCYSTKLSLLYYMYDVTYVKSYIKASYLFANALLSALLLLLFLSIVYTIYLEMTGFHDYIYICRATFVFCMTMTTDKAEQSHT